MMDDGGISSHEGYEDEDEDFSSLIINSAIDGICAYDHNHRLTIWNPVMIKITGFSRNDVIGRNVYERFPFLRGTPLEQAIEDSLKGKTTELGEAPYDIPETGHAGYVRVRLSPLFDYSGHIVGALSVNQEVTEHKRALDEIKSRGLAENQLKFLSEAGILLSSTLDSCEILRRIVDLTTRQFSAWCKVRLLNDDGTFKVYEGHQDPKLAADFARLEKINPYREDQQSGPLWILRNGGHQFQPVMTDEVKKGISTEYEVQRILAPIRSFICVPLETQGQRLGTLSIVGTERAFTAQDLSLAFDLAHWLALSLENARLYARARER